MKKTNFLLLALLSFLTLSLSSCSAIEGIFKAGFAVGIIVVVIVIGLILWAVSSFRK
ncbi:phosphatidate cytidylyltransferase [Mucilaginibacter pedocola]|uniref:phosphatidate cytidylyltransferase n=1 Tax=Mucilaginibacter pedocola TaxID=1792845 RepID=UPI00117D2782|nr:phosphatidate cytidylyltransferase [Mucilaginibacter pedocola]